MQGEKIFFNCSVILYAFSFGSKVVAHDQRDVAIVRAALTARRKAQASNRSSTPKVSKEQPPADDSLVNSTTVQFESKHGAWFRSHLQGSGARWLERWKNLHRASLLWRTLLRYLYINDRWDASSKSSRITFVFDICFDG